MAGAPQRNQGFIPFALQLPALEHWARVLRVKIWAITEDSIDAETCPRRVGERFKDQSLGFRDTTLTMEHQMEKRMDNDMDTRGIEGPSRMSLGYVLSTVGIRPY